MDTFSRAFSAVVDNKKLFKSRAEFCRLSGISSSYASNIANGDAAPLPETLEDWLIKAGVEETTRDDLVFLCRYEKLKADPALGPVVPYFEKRMASLVRSFNALAEFCSKNGLQVPRDLIERVKALDD